jgi:hypothetical protein
MPAPIPYFDVVRPIKNAFNYRLRLVTHARQHGIKAAARAGHLQVDQRLR